MDPALVQLLQGMTNMMRQQSEEMTLFRETVKSLTTRSGESTRTEVSTKAVSDVIDLFTYRPLEDLTFDRWYARYEDTLKDGCPTLDDKGRLRLMLQRFDAPAYRKYSDFILPLKPNERTLKDTVTTCTTLFARQESLFCSRWKCFQLTKSANEDFASYAANVNKMCELFDLKNLAVDDLKSLIFVLGLRDPSVHDIRTRLHNLMDASSAEDKKKVINLEILVAEANRLVNVKSDCKLGATPSSSHAPTVAVVKHKPPKHQKRSFGKDKQQPGHVKPKYPCRRCGAMHMERDCEYISRKCNSCSVVGHKDAYCAVAARIGQNATHKPRQNKVASIRVLPVRVKYPVNDKTSNIRSADFVYKTNANRDKQRKFVSCRINGVPIDLQLDTGADVSIITEQVWILLGKPALAPVRAAPVDASNNPLDTLGELSAAVSLDGQTIPGRCYVARTDQSLFGIPWIEAFQLWNKKPSEYCLQIRSPQAIFDVDSAVQAIHKEFADVFSPSLGCCNITVAQLQLRDPRTTVFRPKREVPYACRQKVAEELDRLEQMGIITPVTYSKFAAPIVIVQKSNGNIRICADYSSGLNDALLPFEHPIPTPDSIFASIYSCGVFSRVDLSDAYLQIPVDDEAKVMLSITTHRGLYNFNRLCPGVKPAAGIFQQVMERMLQGLENVRPYFDDILVYSRDMESHRSTLVQVFQRLRECNLRARMEKCSMFQSSLSFLGIIIDKDGVRPDPEKTAAIDIMPCPTNVSDGLAERFVDTFKRAISKHSSYNFERIQDFLRNYRVTPNPSAPGGKSPSEVMFGRKPNHPLNSLLPPSAVTKNTEMERRYNVKHGARARSFVTGERVTARIGPDANWTLGEIIEKIGSVMYNVHLDDGRLRRLHTNQLRATAVPEQLPFDMLTQEESPAIIAHKPKRTNWRAGTRQSPVKLRPRKK